MGERTRPQSRRLELEEKIKKAASAFADSFNAKLTDNAIAKKIAELQANDKGKVVPPAEWKSIPAKIDPLTGQTIIHPFEVGDVNNETPFASDEELAAVEKEAAQLKAYENALKIKQYQQMIDDLQTKLPTPLPVPHKPAPSATVEGTTGIMSTGRKFR